MAFQQEPTASAIQGSQQVRDVILSHFSSYEATQASLASLSKFFNSLIYVSITVAIIVFFFYLILWAVTAPETDMRRRSVRGAFRGFIVIFLMVSIWGIIRMLDRIFFFSPTDEYLVFIGLSAVLGAWAFFNLGASVLVLLTHAAQHASNFILARVRVLFAQKQFVTRMSDTTLRALIVAVACLLATPFSLYWMFSPSDTTYDTTVQLKQQESFATPVIRGEGDNSVKGNRYGNKQYGISIQFPPGWQVDPITDADSPDGLVSATNDTFTISARLNAGSFSDLPERSRESYLTAFWRVEKHIHEDFILNSSGLLRTEARPSLDVSGASSTLVTSVAYWPLPDGGADPYINWAYMFGTGPLYFTLSFRMPLPESETHSEAVSEEITSILKSITITEPQ